MIRHKLSTSPILSMYKYFGPLFGSVLFIVLCVCGCVCVLFTSLPNEGLKGTHFSQIFVSPLFRSVVAWTHVLK